MARSDDDTWDITEGVGATALGMAMARAGEARVEQPLFSDPLAQVFLDAAVQAGWQYPYTEKSLAELAEANPQVAAQMHGMSSYTASRTKFFDDFYVSASADGVKQAVILAAGLDARAWRLPWPEGTVVYEIDQPKVLAFKSDTLREHGAQPTTGYVAIPIDLRLNWPKALRNAGFDSARPTAWAAEGLLPYLSGEAQDLLFERIQALSAPDSRIAVEAFSPEFFDQDLIARRRAQMQHHREAAGEPAEHDVPATEQLFFFGPRADVADWLRAHHWTVTAVEAETLMASYGRPVPTDVEDAALPSLFVEGRLL
jgi:methyltransferase (TIGR00027 family)